MSGFSRSETRSLLRFYNSVLQGSFIRPRIGEAAGKLKATFDLPTKPADRVLVELNYQGDTLPLRAFTQAFAGATKMFRDNYNTFEEVFGTEQDFIERNRWALREQQTLPSNTPFTGAAHRLGEVDLNAMD